MNEITKIKSVLVSMADRFGMEPQNFERTLRATVVPANCSPEQFAAFLLVAKQYNLNPITKEIYAFPDRRGGVVPIVGVDGWLRIINEQPEMDGMTLMENLDLDDPTGHKVGSITCTIYRKDREHPTVITEYLSECARDTEPWKKWPVRMLRHKAAIQCARYAFGFSGIMEPDEFERGQEGVKSAHKARQDGDWQVLQTEMNQMKTREELGDWYYQNADKIGKLPASWLEHFQNEFERRNKDFIAKEAAKEGVVKKRGRPPKIKPETTGGLVGVKEQFQNTGGVKEQLKASLEAETIEPTTGEIIKDKIPEHKIEDPRKYLYALDLELTAAKTVEDISDIWDAYILVAKDLIPEDQAEADKLFDIHQSRLEQP